MNLHGILHFSFSISHFPFSLRSTTLRPTKGRVVEQHEPIELAVEHISNAPPEETARRFSFQIQFGGSEPPPLDPRFRAPPRRPRRVLPLVLFIATGLSTFLTGGEMFGIEQVAKNPPQFAIDFPKFLMGGLKYSIALMTILGAHEMGHFLQARRYGVPASWPWFIPMPFSPLGTMGAVIVQSSGYADRKQMFDIGITGPLAGLIIAIPVTIWGLQDSRIENIEAFGGGMTFGNPPLLQWLAEWHFGRPLLPNEDIMLTPLLHAGWVGILITALNLIPIGQLDGGHILYGLIRRRAHTVAVFLLWSAVIWTISTGNWNYSAMIFLMLMMGARHPPTRDDSVPLGSFRTVLGWLTLSFVLIGFTPTPFSISQRPVGDKPEAAQPAASPSGDRQSEVPQIEKPMRDHD